MISVLILTKNEEEMLPRCLEAVKWSDDVVVFDSFSTDRTVEIARSFGARVYQRQFDNEREQREASLKVGFKYSWVYNPDADEITPPELRDEMLRVVSEPGRPEVAYRVRFRTLFCGKWLKYSSIYPTWVVRLFQPAKLSFERNINLRYVLDGPEGRLQSHFEHYTFNKGIHAWFDKHNRYSWAEAEESLKSLESAAWNWKDLFGRDSVARRRALKELSFRVPFRPTLRFIYMYFWRMGFLDGKPGWTYCRMLRIYEYMIVLKMLEMRRRKEGLPI